MILLGYSGAPHSWYFYTNLGRFLKCLKGPVVYRAEVTANNKTEYYTGITGNTFKERVTSHFSDFRHIEQRHFTTLSNHIWTLKENNVDYDLVWNLVEESSTYNHTTGKCRLCNREKWHIMFNPEKSTLNTRSEFYSTCRHRLKKTSWKSGVLKCQNQNIFKKLSFR